MEGGRRAGGASNGEEKESIGAGASQHTDQHDQPGGDLQESRAMEGGRRAGFASNGDEFEGAGAGASPHADQHGHVAVTFRIKGDGRRPKSWGCKQWRGEREYRGRSILTH